MSLDATNGTVVYTPNSGATRDRHVPVRRDECRSAHVGTGQSAGDGYHQPGRAIAHADAHANPNAHSHSNTHANTFADAHPRLPRRLRLPHRRPHLWSTSSRSIFRRSSCPRKRRPRVWWSASAVHFKQGAAENVSDYHLFMLARTKKAGLHATKPINLISAAYNATREYRDTEAPGQAPGPVVAVDDHRRRNTRCPRATDRRQSRRPERRRLSNVLQRLRPRPAPCPGGCFRRSAWSRAKGRCRPDRPKLDRSGPTPWNGLPADCRIARAGATARAAGARQSLSSMRRRGDGMLTRRDLLRLIPARRSPQPRGPRRRRASSESTPTSTSSATPRRSSRPSGRPTGTGCRSSSPEPVVTHFGRVNQTLSFCGWLAMCCSASRSARRR